MLAAQIKIEGAKTYPQFTINSILKIYPSSSGAGNPVVGKFFGGHAATCFTDLNVTKTNKMKYATGCVVKKGLLSNIKPLWCKLEGCCDNIGWGWQLLSYSKCG